MDVEGEREANKRQTLCFNSAGMDFEKPPGDMIKSCGELEPALVVMNNDIDEDIRQRTGEHQKNGMRYTVHIDGSNITTNSTQVIAQLKIKNMLEDTTQDNGERCMGKDHEICAQRGIGG